MSPIKFFTQRKEETLLEIQAISKNINRLAIARLALILGGGWGLFTVIQTERVLPTIAFFLGLVLLFFLLIQRHGRANRKKELLEYYLALNENEIQTLEDATSNIYSNGAIFKDDMHAYSSDLDLFGEKSLFQYLNRSASKAGARKLATWMQHADTREEIIERQGFVGELASKISWLQRFQTALFPLIKEQIDPADLIRGLINKPLSFPKLSLIASYANWAPILLLFSIGFTVWDQRFAPSVLLLGLLHLFIGIYFSRLVSSISDRFNKAKSALEHYVPAFYLIEEGSWESEMPQRLVGYLNVENGHVSVSIEKLTAILSRLDARLNQFVGGLLNIVLLWDIRQVAALEKWQRSMSSQLPKAFEVVSIFEAIGSLASLQFRQPDWAVPEILPNERPYIDAHEIKHPLINPREVVANSYTNQTHRIGLITGSNMAGKSTFLRTLGINGVLAYCGAPVCAKALHVSVFKWITYMRIRDSVNDGTSTFKAELNRIEKVLDLVKRDSRVFVLLDELLRGTNSTDKYLGSKAILIFLLKAHAYGLLATHDLKLAELEKAYSESLQNFHFDIQVEEEQMVFDYKLKSGPCAIFNASLLLQKIGIEIQNE